MDNGRNETRITTGTPMLRIKDFLNVPRVFEWRGEQSITKQRIAHIEWLLGECIEDGDNLEFGVYKGFTLNSCADYEPDNIFWGFDSFKGLPEDWKLNETFTVSKHTRWNLDALPEVRDNVRLVPGWFYQTIPHWLKQGNSQGHIRWLNIDSDLYSSAKCVLTHLNDKIVDGTIIHFDELCDWRWLQNKGIRRHAKSPVKVYRNWREHEWKALNEWIQKFNRKIKPISRSYSQASGIRVVK